MSNEKIVAQIQQGIDVTANQERLWEQNKGFVAQCIRKYVGGCDGQDFNDFLQEGFIGLVEAAHSYDAGQGVKFLTYAEYSIRRAVYRYNGLNTYMVRVPEYLKARMRKLAAFKQKYREEHHRDPEPQKIQDALHISYRSLCHLEKTIMGMSTRSLDGYISDDGAPGWPTCFQRMKRLTSWQGAASTKGSCMGNWRRRLPFWMIKLP